MIGELLGRVSNMIFWRKRAPEFEPADDRRRRFLAAADQMLPDIPLPEEQPGSIRVAEARTLSSNGYDPARVVWAISTKAGDHFLTVNRTPYLNDERWVVFVKARLFFAAWLASRDQPTGMTGDPPDVKDLPTMNAWKYQSRSWGHGLKNPVPLAEIGSGSLHHPDCHLAFVNGRNRVAWLIYHGAAAFPVEVNTELAAWELHKMMGLEGWPPKTVEELTGWDAPRPAGDRL